MSGTDGPLAPEERQIEEALRFGRETRSVVIEPGARRRTASVFASLFGSTPAVVVADENTFAAAGRDAQDSFYREGGARLQPFVFESGVRAEISSRRRLQAALEPLDAVPVAVGSGTINDITKLAAHRLNRPYMSVATAASMDGYAASGASITRDGSKQTISCLAPRAVLVDLEVIAAAPPGLNAAGYADLLAKRAAGGDWILADAAGEEAIDRKGWDMVQPRMRAWLASPGGIARGEPQWLRRLTYGLILSGLAMQATRTSRPASGAEHQFSHLWDMQGHTHEGAAPLHGFKVGIGTLASLALYEQVLAGDDGMFSIERAAAGWPSREDLEKRIAAEFGAGALEAIARRETLAKYLSLDDLRGQLARLRARLGGVRATLRDHLFSFQEARSMLREAGCPCAPEQIGISRERLRASYRQAFFIRRRYTVLDFVERWGLMRTALEALFAAGGPWLPRR